MASGRNKQPIIFWGTSEICTPFLEALYDYFDISLIITQPDSMGGRGRRKIIPPVKNFAIEREIDFIQPVNLRDKDIYDKLINASPVIGVVISYGKLIPRSLFSIPVHRTVNVHFSLLPYYRGAAPVQRAIENGDKKTGITIFEIARKLDSGDIWTQKEFDIFDDDTTLSVWNRLSVEGGPFLKDTLQEILAGHITKSPQDHDLATFAPAVEKSESKADWNLSASQLYNKSRAFFPWPGLCCSFNGKIFKLTNIRVLNDSEQVLTPGLMAEKTPGDIIALDKKSLKICCGNSSVLEILEIQPPGKKPMSPFNFCLGNCLPDKLA